MSTDQRAITWLPGEGDDEGWMIGGLDSEPNGRAMSDYRRWQIRRGADVVKKGTVQDWMVDRASRRQQRVVGLVEHVTRVAEVNLRKESPET